MRGRQFKGTPEAMAAYQPFITSRSLQTKGIPVGPKSDLGDLMVFHPHTLPGNTANISIEGEQDAGKSTFSKSMTLRCSMLQARDNKMQLEKWRTRIRSRRSERGFSEYAPVADYLGASHSKIGKGRRINLLGLLDNPTDMIKMAVYIVQEIGGRYTDVRITPGITIAVYRLFKEARESAGERMIEQVLRGLVLDDFVEYMKTTRDEAMKDFAREFNFDERVRKQLNLDYEAPPVDGSYIEAAIHAADCLAVFMGPDYGDAFGGTLSFYDMLTPRVVLLDTEDIPIKADTILESVMIAAETSAIQYQDKLKKGEKDPTLIIPHLEISEEEGVAMKSLMHARTIAERQAVTRKFPTSHWRLLQHGAIQLGRAGAAESELRSLSAEIDNGYGARFVLRQANNDEVLHRYTRFMSDQLVQQLPYLNNGEAFLLVKGQDPVRFQHRLLRRELAMIQSNFQRDRMSTFTPVYEMDEYRKRLEHFSQLPPEEFV